MKRCLQCDRDYPESFAFCHLCGERLHSKEDRAAPPVSAAPAGAGHRRPRAPVRAGASHSLLFAVLVLVGAGAGLAIVWRDAWMPSIPRVTVMVSRPQDLRPPDPPPSSATAPAESPATPAAPEAALPTPAPEPAPAAPEPAAPAPVTPPGRAAAITPEPAPAAVTPAPPSAKKAPEPAAVGKGASRSDPPPATAERTPPVDAQSKPAGSSPRLLSARADPSTSVPSPGARVIWLVPVGGAPGARGQLTWEPLGGGVLVVSGLPRPPVGRTYQLWLGSIDGGNRVSAGLLMVDAQGAGTLRVAPPRAQWSPDIFGVTMERQGGAREPSEDLVLVGELPKRTAAAPGTGSGAPAGTGSDGSAGTAKPPPADAAPASEPATTASLAPPVVYSRGSDGQLTRVVSVPMDRTWLVA